jgi:hypothetical protein
LVFFHIVIQGLHSHQYYRDILQILASHTNTDSSSSFDAAFFGR